MLCPNCAFDNPNNMLYCGMCGTHIATTCPNCQAGMPTQFVFCGQCGQRIHPAPDEGIGSISLALPDGATPPETQHPLSTGNPPMRAVTTPLVGERRLATILVADVKGSTNLMETLGTETWVEVMNRILQVMAGEIYRFGGEVDQFRGDGLVAFFGARSAHEDDPERTVLAGLMIQIAVQQLSTELEKTRKVGVAVRVGINTGEVIAGNIGNLTQHNEDTAMGGAIALAARLESAAEPGTILVSEDTYRLTELNFKWESLGNIQVRGISRPVAVYRPVAPLSESQQEHRLQEYGLSIPLIGRDEEIQQIENTITDLRHGVGGIVMINGEAGLGKSRLISEVQLAVRREEALLPEGNEPITWLRGRSRSYGQSLPHSMWVDVLQRWLGTEEYEQTDTLERLQQKCQDLWGEKYENYYPYLAKFLSLPLEKTFVDWIGHLEAEGLRHQFFLVIKDWVTALAQRGPLIISFTEVHWADEASLALLEHCLPLCDQYPIVWMIVYRPDPKADSWRLSHFVETEFPHRLTAITLKQLSNAKSRDLLERLVGQDILPERLETDIITKAEGNPYYLTEIVRSLVDRGILEYDDDHGRWQVTQDDAAVDLPTGLVSLLAARISRLSTEEQRVLQLAAVIGNVFWADLLQELAGEHIRIEKCLTSLQRSRLIRERGCLSDLGTEYVFLSALIREAAYENLLGSQRSRYHRIIAEYLEKLVQESSLPQYHGFIAYHYEQAEICQKELFHTLLAAENAQKLYAHTEALQLYNRAIVLLDNLGECDEPPGNQAINEWRLEVLTGLGKIHFGIGNVATAEKYLREAVALGRQVGVATSALTRLFYWLGEVLFWQNQFEEPIHLGEEGLYYLGENNQNIEAALMNQLVAIGCSQLGDHEKFIDFTQRTAGFIQNLPYTEELRPAYDHIIGLYAYTLKEIDKAEEWLRIFQQKSEAHHDLRALGEIYNHKASLAFRQGDVQTGLAFFSKAIDLFSQIGDDKHTCRSLRWKGTCYLQTGWLEKAEEFFLQSLELAQVFDNPIDYALGYWLQAQVYRCRGETERAAKTFQKAQELVLDIPVIQGGWAFLGLGQVHFSQGNTQEITGNFQSILENDPYLIYKNPYQATNILSKLERSFENPASFRDFADDFQRRHPEISHAQFKQWYLKPGAITPSEAGPTHEDRFRETMPNYLAWIDPFGDCSYTVNNGLNILAANERNFHHINLSAPRLIYKEPFKYDFALETTCRPLSDQKPGIGGLLVWQNDKNWLCLEFGARGPDEVIFRGFKDNHDRVFGRGRLYANATHLRLEKHGYHISAFCSPTGTDWLYVGSTHISTREPIQLGLHANGHINRLIYPGAYPEGTAIQFNSLKIWVQQPA